MNNKCPHTITRHEGKNMVCEECGVTVYTLEERECRDCKSFKIAGGIPICKKKMMTVLPEMHVNYKVAEGTCFE